MVSNEGYENILCILENRKLMRMALHTEDGIAAVAPKGHFTMGLIIEKFRSNVVCPGCECRKGMCVVWLGMFANPAGFFLSS